MTSCYHIFNKLASHAMCLIWQKQIRMLRFLIRYNYSIDRTIIVNENLIGFIILCVPSRAHYVRFYTHQNECTGEALQREFDQKYPNLFYVYLKERSL